MRKNPHVRICGGPGSATTLVYPTTNHPRTAAVERQQLAEGVLVGDIRSGALLLLFESCNTSQARPRGPLLGGLPVTRVLDFLGFRLRPHGEAECRPRCRAPAFFLSFRAAVTRLSS